MSQCTQMVTIGEVQYYCISDDHFADTPHVISATASASEQEFAVSRGWAVENPDADPRPRLDVRELVRVVVEGFGTSDPALLEEEIATQQRRATAWDSIEAALRELVEAGSAFMAICDATPAEENPLLQTDGRRASLRMDLASEAVYKVARTALSTMEEGK